MINVTKPFLPPKDEYNRFLERIWNTGWLTNNGELAQELTLRLKKYLGSNYLIPMTNGTLPIQIALNYLAHQGEVITTPFSYVATTSSIVWEKCTPVFVDIEADHLTIDAKKIEAAITDKTTAILTTHVYGNPCNIEAIEKIANQYNLKVIYDAAHCFGVKYKGQSIFNYGDVSTCSFHATKLFHTAEGGALFCNEKQVFDEIYYRHNFGHNGELEYHGLGINSKISELQAAMGLSVLPYMDQIISERKKLVELYDSLLNFSDLRRIKIRKGTDWNYSYYPIIFNSEEKLLKSQKALKEQGINPRRYFYPSLTELPYIEKVDMEVADDISKRVLCCPIYYSLAESDVNRICQIINANL